MRRWMSILTFLISPWAFTPSKLTTDLKSQPSRVLTRNRCKNNWTEGWIYQCHCKKWTNILNIQRNPLWIVRSYSKNIVQLGAVFDILAQKPSVMNSFWHAGYHETNWFAHMLTGLLTWTATTLEWRLLLSFSREVLFS